MVSRLERKTTIAFAQTWLGREIVEKPMAVMQIACTKENW